MIAVLRIEQHENASCEGVDRNAQDPLVPRKILLDPLFQLTPNDTDPLLYNGPVL